jgi:hypothetical protein
MDESQALKEENEELKKIIASLRYQLAEANRKIMAYSSQSRRDWEYDRDYLPYEEDDRR